MTIKEDVIGVEEYTDTPSPPINLPSLEIALEHARNQHEHFRDSIRSLETKGAIALSAALAMIAIIYTVNPDSESLVIFFLSLVGSITTVLPRASGIPGPDMSKIEKVYKFAKKDRNLAMDELLRSYTYINHSLKHRMFFTGCIVFVAFILNAIGIYVFVVSS